MLDLAIMIEGQNGLTWPRWMRIAQAAEDLGFAGLYRSDHFTNANAPDIESLELWISLTWLASHTKRIQFGPLVSPVSFRHPALTARMAAGVDDLSNGRLYLGVGAGWQEREHTKFGFDLLSLNERFNRFEEGLHVLHALLNSDEPGSFDGKYYQLREAVMLPRPQRPGGPPILIGGNGEQRTLPLAARFAKAWNAVFVNAQQFTELNTRLDRLLADQNRQSTEVHRSLMTGVIFSRDQAELDAKLSKRSPEAIENLRQRGVLVGTAGQLVDQLGDYARAGVQRVMMQWLDLDDMAGLEAIARDVLPHYPSSAG